MPNDTVKWSRLLCPSCGLPLRLFEEQDNKILLYCCRDKCKSDHAMEGCEAATEQEAWEKLKKKVAIELGLF